MLKGNIRLRPAIRGVLDNGFDCGAAGQCVAPVWVKADSDSGVREAAISTSGFFKAADECCRFSYSLLDVPRLLQHPRPFNIKGSIEVRKPTVRRWPRFSGRNRLNIKAVDRASTFHCVHHFGVAFGKCRPHVRQQCTAVDGAERLRKPLQPGNSGERACNLRPPNQPAQKRFRQQGKINRQKQVLLCVADGECGCYAAKRSNVRIIVWNDRSEFGKIRSRTNNARLVAEGP